MREIFLIGVGIQITVLSDETQKRFDEVGHDTTPVLQLIQTLIREAQDEHDYSPYQTSKK